MKFPPLLFFFVLSLLWWSTHFEHVVSKIISLSCQLPRLAAAIGLDLPFKKFANLVPQRLEMKWGVLDRELHHLIGKDILCRAFDRPKSLRDLASANDWSILG